MSAVPLQVREYTVLLGRDALTTSGHSLFAVPPGRGTSGRGIPPIGTSNPGETLTSSMGVDLRGARPGSNSVKSAYQQRHGAAVLHPAHGEERIGLGATLLPPVSKGAII